MRPSSDARRDLWRKTPPESSLVRARKKFAPGTDAKLLQTLLAAGLLASPVTAAWASGRLDEVVYFDIPQQRADLALTAFAEQADLTLIFPYEKVSEITANRLIGEYSIEEAISRLLANTPVKMAVSANGQLSIIAQATGESDIVHRRNKLSHALMTIMAAMFGAREGMAQDVEQGVLEEVTVTGIRASMTRSRDVKRRSEERRVGNECRCR